jgi:hypothetical protein
MNMTPCYRTTILLGAALLLSGPVARAQSGDSAAAQALFDQAKKLMADGNSADACPKLEESQRLDPRSGTLINLARCYEGTNRLASAWSTYIEAATAAKAAGNSEREGVARERAATLVPRLSKLTIVVAPALKGVQGLELTRDGVAVREPSWGLPLPTDAGEHEVTAKAPGHAPFAKKVTVSGEGAITTVSVPELALDASPSAAQGPSGNTAPATPDTGSKGGTARTLAVVAGGIGVVGVGLGTAFGLASKSKHDEAAQYCSGAECTDARGVTAGKSALTDGNISTIAMIVGGVGLATAVTLWLTAPSAHADEPAAQVGLGFGTVQVRGAF